LYFLLTMGFTYFYTAFTFKPDETADQLRKNGGFIPGIRPGAPTRDYLARVVYRISLAGAIFLGIVAVSPVLVSMAFSGGVVGNFALGGTALLIVVSVVVETMKQLEAQLMMRNYEGFIR
jgi:preprotein translocase subunit SecY